MTLRQRIEADAARALGTRRWGAWFVVALWALVLVPFAGTRDLYYEEGRYTLAALDMLQHGHWLRPEVLGEGFVAKPPLLFWLVASAVSLGGVSEWVVRAPALIAALLGALLVEREGRRGGGARAGLLAAVAFLASPYVFAAGSRAEPDLLVSVASFGAFTIWLESRGPRQETAILPWAATSALLAATALLKGPLPLAWFGIGAGLVVVRERRWRELPGLALTGGIALSAFLAWAGVVYQPGDEAAFRDMTRTGGGPPLAAYLEGVVRFVGETAAHLLPWLALAAFAVRLAWLAAIPLDPARNEAARRLADKLDAPLKTSRDPVLILGPAIDYNAAFYLQQAGHPPRVVSAPGEVVPPAWLITAAPPPPRAREVARATGRRGVVYRVYRVETAD